MSIDPTEFIRSIMVNDLNLQIQSQDEQSERRRLEKIYKDVYNKEQLQEKFIIHDFLAPFVFVKEKSTNKEGALLFQHYPRFYFNFQVEM